ncbi:MAG: hypothetical protein HQ521_09390 [Bacteroidetes bacterium]|nr:hypothetical protein [Bacteroidota bacterium]
MKTKPIDTLVYALAFLIPFYLVFYQPLYENPEARKNKTIWKFIIAGLVTYVILGVVYYLIKN